MPVAASASAPLGAQGTRSSRRAIDAPVLLVDVDADSPARGRLVPRSLTMVIDDYLPCCAGGGASARVHPRRRRTWAAVILRCSATEGGRWA
jgi:hypothetical protein